MIIRDINELLPLTQLVFIIAESGSGKSTLIKLFLKNIYLGEKIFIQSKDAHKDFSEFLYVTFLPETFIVTEEHFNSLPDNSIVILDDFTLKSNKLEFLQIINYTLRHRNILLFLIIHNLYNTKLLNEILLSPHILLAYSNLGWYCLRKLAGRLGGPNVLQFYNEPPRFSFHFLYINANKNYLINCVDYLFTEHPTTMFTNNTKFVIHEINQPCYNDTETLKNETNIEKEILSFLESTYPKNKGLPIIFKILLKNNLINEDLFFKDFPKIHIADFCAFILNRFNKSIDQNILKLCKHLKKSLIKFPRTTIKNKEAQKYFI